MTCPDCLQLCSCGEMVNAAWTMHWLDFANRVGHRVDGSDRKVEAAPILPAETRTEKDIQHAIKAALRLRGFNVWDTSQPFAAKITPGLPDLIVGGSGRLAFVEVKRSDGKLTEAQEMFRAVALEANVEHYVWRSEADAIRWIEAA